MLIPLSLLAASYMGKVASISNNDVAILDEIKQCQTAVAHSTQGVDNYFTPISASLACYYGPLDKANVDAALKWSQSGTLKYRRTLVVKSPGGDANLGILLGNSLLGQRTLVAVDDICLSSCANYLFLPAFKKYIKPYSLVVFHGGAAKSMAKDISKSNLPKQQKKLAYKALDELYNKQNDLFSRAKVNGSFLEKYYNTKFFSKSDLLNCTNSKSDVVGIALTYQQYRNIGADVKGYIASSKNDLYESLSKQGKGDKSLCIAPPYLFK